MQFIINGRPVEASFDLRTSLLDLLREHHGLMGSKKGCDQGACGACRVLANGERINACLALAVQYQDCVITTVEGLGEAGALHPLQRAFIEHDGFQCGYCTPGRIRPFLHGSMAAWPLDALSAGGAANVPGV